MRTELWLRVLGAGVAVLALVASFYFFSAGVLFDAGCHAGNQAACLDKARTLRLSLVLAIMFVVIGGVTGALWLRDARARKRAARTADGYWQ